MKLRFLTAGESHGRGLFGILEGIPSGLALQAEWIQKEMRRRKIGFGRGDRQKIETDQVEIFSGVRFGRTLGSPICLGIWNQDWENWKDIMKVGGSDEEAQIAQRQVGIPRPGHADLMGGIKYAHSDMRNVLERASARETAIRVALGSVARILLESLGVRIQSRVVSIGGVKDPGEYKTFTNEQADLAQLRCLDSEVDSQMVRLIEEASQEGDTLGGEFEVRVEGLPMGLGSYVQWDRRLEAEIGKALLSLNAIQGVETGLGFCAAMLRGSQVHDEIIRREPFLEAPDNEVAEVGFLSNKSGGIVGGMSTGQPLWVRAAMKPLSTLRKPLRSVNLKSGEPTVAHFERSDVCAVPSAAVIAESLLALVLADAVLDKFGGDSMGELQARTKLWNQDLWKR